MNDALKAMRKRSGLSQMEVAESLNIQQSTVAMWETGENVPRTDKLPELARLYHCSIDDLFRTEAENDEAGLQR